MPLLPPVTTATFPCSSRSMRQPVGVGGVALDDFEQIALVADTMSGEVPLPGLGQRLVTPGEERRAAARNPTPGGAGAGVTVQGRPVQASGPRSQTGGGDMLAGYLSSQAWR